MKKSKGVIISCSILGGLMLIFSIIAIGLGFQWNLFLDLERTINIKWGWASFDLLVWSFIIAIVFAVAIIAILTISDDKANRAAKRERKNSFQ